MKRLLFNGLFMVLAMNNVASIEAMERMTIKGGEYSSAEAARLGANLASIAISIGIPVGLLIYRARAYGGLDVLLAAWHYELERGRDLLLLKNAKNHNDRELKRELLLLNETMLGKDWRMVRPQLVDDFVDMNRFTFTAKYSADMRERLLYLLNVYAAASDLYFRRYNPMTYIQPYTFTTTSSKARGMYQLDRKLGIVEPNVLR